MICTTLARRTACPNQDGLPEGKLLVSFRNWRLALHPMGHCIPPSRHRTK
jgi:hypothetical protein